MQDKLYNALFVCTGNSARSVHPMPALPLACLDRMVIHSVIKDIGRR